jgi:hypothetical protein
MSALGPGDLETETIRTFGLKHAIATFGLGVVAMATAGVGAAAGVTVGRSVMATS